MLKKRPWGKYPERFRTTYFPPYEIWMKVSGAVLVVCVIGSLQLFDKSQQKQPNSGQQEESEWSPIKKTITALSILTTGVLVLIPAIKSIPPSFIEMNYVINKTITLAKFNNLNLQEKPILLGVIGNEQAGKTSLIKVLKLETTDNSNTVEIDIHIMSFRENPQEHFIGYIDGRGDDIGHQNIIVNHADILIIVVDHNAANNKPEIDQERLRQQKDRNEHLIRLLKAGNGPPKTFKSIILVRSKKDLLDLNTDKKLQTFLTTLKYEWRLFLHNSKAHEIDYIECDLRNIGDVSMLNRIIRNKLIN